WHSDAVLPSRRSPSHHSRRRPAIASHVRVPSLAKPRSARLTANVRRPRWHTARVSYEDEKGFVRVRATHRYNLGRASPGFCLPLPGMSKAYREHIRGAGALSRGLCAGDWKVERLHSRGRLWWKD